MKWQCALLQRWLPEYPDGDLPAFWKGRLQAHLAHCPACREMRARLAHTQDRGAARFSAVGILASVAAPLAAAGVSIFAVSTFDTDYVMVKEQSLDAAIGALEAAGHRVSR